VTWGSPVESESEFVEVRVEMLMTHGAVVGSHEPTLQKRYDTVNARKEFGSSILFSAERSHLVNITLLVQASVPTPSVCMYYAAFFNRFYDEAV
jgi:hypothetical protein